MTTKKLSCVDCGTINCEYQNSMYPDFCLTTALSEEKLAEVLERYDEEENHRVTCAAAEVETEGYLRKTRVEEVMMFAEKIGASEEEIKAKMEEMAKNYGKKVEELSENENLKKYLDEGIKSEKALAFIVENAKFAAAKKETKKQTKKSDK